MDILIQIIKELEKRIERQERLLSIKDVSIPSDGTFVPKVLSSDPVSPASNEVWINSTSNQLKWRKGSTTKTINFV